MAKKRLSDSPPRETAGRDTILRFDYQFRKTAEASLRLLEEKDLERVFCDYHDDYVLKVWENKTAVFMFHQVKTKGKEAEQWTRKEIFGIGERMKSKAGEGKSSIAGKLFFHHISFGPNCKSVHIVTNAHFKEEIDALVQDVRSAKVAQDLHSKNDFSKKIFEFFATEFENTTEDGIFDFLKKLEVRSNSGKLHDPNGDEEAIYLKRIYDYSEISLAQSQAKKIGQSLLSLVKKKSIAEIPGNVTEADLEKYASIELSDVLQVLSISQAAYKELKAGGDPKALRNASILQRLLKRSGANETMTVSACKAKVGWENWIRQYRHAMTETDFFTLQAKVSDALKMHVRGNLTLPDLSTRLNSITGEFQGKLPSGIALNVDLIFGLFWSLAVMEELQ